MLLQRNLIKLFIAVYLVLLISCDLTEAPKDTTTEDAVFGSENGLELYTNSFYPYLPSANDITRGDAMSDYGSTNSITAIEFVIPGAYTSESHNQGWNWGELRNINHFLVNNVNPEIPQEIRAHYNGIARFFRAWFYFDKVKRFGDVPWIDVPLDYDDPDLEAGRDSREMVMNNVLEDLDYAIENIRVFDESSRSQITQSVALALKSRIALFEGTFRKYHPEFGLEGSANAWLQEAVDASNTIIESGAYNLYTGSGTDASYRNLFITDNPNSAEDILAVISDEGLDVRHSSNWWLTSGTFGIRLNFTRQFINTYLTEDGTPFTDIPGYESMTFLEETQNRDPRLKQTIRTPGYERVDAGVVVPSPPTFTYTQTGYQPIKWVVDDVGIDGGNNNTNSVTIFRFAEVLLNYAEAKAELGTLTAEDWQNTIGALRQRAGITGGTSSLPDRVDPYLQEMYYPNVNDPIVLEIRRDRAIELVFEGFRFDDVRRWAVGEVMEKTWNGFYVPSANEYIDLSGNGEPNVYFYTTPSAPDNQISGVQYVNVGSDQHTLTNGESGELVWLPNTQRVWENHKYLYPIPHVHIQRNPNLTQNPGW
jgi:starch-binding outer membrane protein, SusD/RagB family